MDLAQIILAANAQLAPETMALAGGKGVTGFAIDNRKVAPGTIFGAFQGAQNNGEDFIPAAIAAGAVAVVAREQAAVEGAVHIASDNPRQTFAHLTAQFFTPVPEVIVAVTGTNGKTSTVEMTRQIWRICGMSAASIGTLGVTSSDESVATGLTTPDIVTFHSNMSGLAREGVSHVAYEASSHGLSQYRNEGLSVCAGAFTNFSRDHLDYHQTMEAYFAAKMRLVQEVLSDDAVLVVWDAGDDWSAKAIAEAKARGLRVFSVGEQGEHIRLLKRVPTQLGQELTIAYAGQERSIILPLIGAYQAANALVAGGLALNTFYGDGDFEGAGGAVGAGGAQRSTQSQGSRKAQGAAEAQSAGRIAQTQEAIEGGTEHPQAARIFDAIARLQPVRGRLERAVITRSGAPVYVDYAHTADALIAAMQALRPHVSGRLITVFGAGGDRDQGKRAEMGRAAAQYGDINIVTDDNPRGEEPASIRKQILAEAPQAMEIGDRRAAIAQAVAMASAQDIVLLAGKGHEQGQIIGAGKETRILPFDDVSVARECAASQTAEGADIAGSAGGSESASKNGGDHAINRSAKTENTSSNPKEVPQ